MLQVFESSADFISKETFAEVSLPYCKAIRDRLHERLAALGVDPVPMVIYAKGGSHSLREQSQLGYEVVGIDWTIDPVDARAAVGPNITLQGNLDPQDLYKTPVIYGFIINCQRFFLIIRHCLQDELKALTESMVRKFGRTRYIANLGHGITPATPIESMHVFVDTVHNTVV